MIRNNLLEQINEDWSNEKSSKKIESELNDLRVAIIDPDFNSILENSTKNYDELSQITLRDVLE